MSNETLINITVVPKSSKSEIIIEGDNLKAYLNSPPLEGKANAELTKLLSKKLDIAKSRIKIVKGEKGRKKRILIEGLSKKDVVGLI